MEIKENYTLSHFEMQTLARAFLNAQELLSPKFKNETKAEMQLRMNLSRQRIADVLKKLNDRIYDGTTIA